MDNNTCCFEAGARNTVCSVRVIADVLPEDDEDFYFAIVPQNGQLICRKNFAIGIIQNVEGIYVCFEYTVCTVCKMYGINRIRIPYNCVELIFGMVDTLYII